MDEDETEGKPIRASERLSRRDVTSEVIAHSSSSENLVRRTMWRSRRNWRLHGTCNDNFAESLADVSAFLKHTKAVC